MKSGKAEPAMTPLQAKKRAGLMALLSSLSYSFCSVSMVMSNKVSLSPGLRCVNNSKNMLKI